ncbi:hypothetical protein G3A_12375 [Bacillus sp. 17376]|uniref:RND multidrug efflux transporter n=1 Tax=Mesobacillus boroniphilus JCM 21738 TaxID=1294265 RepID=W4RI67_9BACI|nr:hypothetical protein [Mesobacillus boroniphilus]ESU32253.1 hypothetical protein G3A_12375 [Bacillus sp. 17376]GAE43842.1 hypothetical protein JCM21738_505 [Mesobacillus boroniphilus JCM 21738]
MNKALDEVKDIGSYYVMDNGNMLYTVINMTKGDEITREQKDVNEKILKSLRGLEEKVPLKSAAAAMSGGGGSPVRINISGESFDELQTIADGFIEELKTIEGIVAAENSIERTSVEQVVQLNESEIEKAGLSQPQIKQFIEQAFLQMPVGELKINEENVPLKVKWDEEMTQE